MSDDYNFATWPQFGRLFNGVVIPCTMDEWCANYKDFEKNMRVASDYIEGAHVSTVFLGLNHGFGVHATWFETMIFDLEMHEKDSQPQWRYETLAQAQEGHSHACAWVREHLEVMRAERRDALLADSPTAKPPLP